MKNSHSMLLLAVFALMGLPGGAVVAEQDHHHESHAEPAALALDHGNKWSTDAPLRQGMGAIREQVGGQLQAIHQGIYSAQEFAQLANQIDQQVAGIVRQCKLTPEADANLHLVIAQLAKGTQLMRQADQAELGLEQVMAALQSYSQYFNDASFSAALESLQH
jgi:hypothetical protein